MVGDLRGAGGSMPPAAALTAGQDESSAQKVPEVGICLGLAEAHSRD